MPPPTSRSLPNLALEADPPSDLDPDDDASSLLLDLVDAPSAPPELELAPPVTFTAPSTPRASPRLGKRARSDDEDVEPGWGAPPDEALARDEPGRPGPDPHIRERSASLGGGSIHSAPELELEQRPDSPSLASPAGGIERGLRAESPAPLSDGDEAGSGNGNGNGTGRDAEREGRRRRRRAGERLATLWDYLQEEVRGSSPLVRSLYPSIEGILTTARDAGATALHGRDGRRRGGQERARHQLPCRAARAREGACARGLSPVLRHAGLTARRQRADYRLWRLHLPRLVPLHLHHPPPPRLRRRLPARLERSAQPRPPRPIRSNAAQAPPAPVAQMRPDQGGHPRGDARAAAQGDGREQDVPRRARTRDNQALRALQRARGAPTRLHLPLPAASLTPCPGPPPPLPAI